MLAVDVIDRVTLDRLGPGPLQGIQSATITTPLDGAGTVTVELAASHARTALLVPNQTTYVQVVVDGASDASQIGCVAVRTTTPYTVALQLRGATLLDELNRSIVARLALESAPGSGLPMPAADILPAILAGTGWTATGTPSRDVYHQFGDERTLAALIKLRELLGDHFRISRTVPRQIEWLAAGADGYVPAASGLIAKEAPDADADACLIARDSLQLVADGGERITRLYPRGAGNADAQVFITRTTLGTDNPGDGTPGDYVYGAYTIHIDSVPARSYIAHTASDATGPSADEETYSDLTPISDTATDDVSAANELVKRAIVTLRLRLVEQLSLRCTLVRADLSRLIEGTSIVVRARYYTDAYGWLTVDEPMLIQQVPITYSALRPPQVTLQVARIGADVRVAANAPAPLTQAAVRWLMQAAVTVQELRAQPQTAERLKAIDTTTPAAAGQALVWNPARQKFEPVTLPAGGATVSDEQLIEWTAGEDFELLSITYDGTSTGVIATATVLWPDGSVGTFTTTTINTTWEAIDAFTITHADSGKTVTQAAVTRNADGNVTVKPPLSVTP